MRNALSQSLVALASDPDFVFLTGDLGYKALEPLMEALGERFINAGVAEQNMVSVAAGLAKAGLRPWAYSIAPFIYARPFEQIRNDVCLHRLPVVLVGNGGGYAYGVMGSTHHALEDYGVLTALPGLRAYVPAFSEDVEAVIGRLSRTDHPAYLRLGRDERPAGYGLPEYAPWRRLLQGGGPTVVAVGPLVGTYLASFAALPEAQCPALWIVTELPILASDLPGEFLDDLKRSDSLCVVEEHVAQGGAGRMLAAALLEAGVAPRIWRHRAACGYRDGVYGSQAFHRAQCGLDGDSLIRLFAEMTA